MKIKRARPAIKKSQLENEVILAVVLLYVFLSAVLLAIHHIRPAGNETLTSSTSPAHGEFSASAPKPPSESAPEAGDAPTAEAAQRILDLQGFEAVEGIHPEGSAFRATATKDGKTWQVEVDVASRTITRTQ